MKYDPQKHHRRSIRLTGYDYTQPGAYFVTLVTFQRQPLFGQIVGDQIQLTPLGQIVQQEWTRSAGMRREIELHHDEIVIMPNHLHGIVWLVDVGADGVRPDGIRLGDGARPDDGIHPIPADPGAYHAPLPHRGDDVGADGVRPGVIRPDNGVSPIHGFYADAGIPPTPTEPGAYHAPLPHRGDDVGADGVRPGVIRPDDGVSPIHGLYADAGIPPTLTEPGAYHAPLPSRGGDVGADGVRPDDGIRPIPADSGAYSGAYHAPLPHPGGDVGADGVRPGNRPDDGVSPIHGLYADAGIPPTLTELPYRGDDVGADGVRPNGTRLIHDQTPDDQGARAAPLRREAQSLASFVAGFKASVTSRARRELDEWNIWQRNYYEHIIRNEAELTQIRDYIQTNPLRWDADQLHPSAPPNRFNQE